MLSRTNDVSQTIKILNDLELTDGEKREKLPAYTRKPEFSSCERILSPLGGADVTPAVFKEAKCLYILDRNPFLTQDSLYVGPNAEENRQQNRNEMGLFNEGMATLLRERSPHKYGTMFSGYDHDHYSGLLNMLAYNDAIPDNIRSSVIDHVKSEILSIGWEQNFQKTIEVRNMGISTPLLLRIRTCLNGTIQSIEELVENGVYQINVLKPNGEQLSIYYVQTTLGTPETEHDPAYQWLKQDIETHGVDTVISRGFPSDIFNTAPVGLEQMMIQDFDRLIENSPTPIQHCISCTIKGGVPAPFFNRDCLAMDANNQSLAFEAAMRAPEQITFYGPQTMLQHAPKKQVSAAVGAQPSPKVDSSSDIKYEPPLYVEPDKIPQAVTKTYGENEDKSDAPATVRKAQKRPGSSDSSSDSDNVPSPPITSVYKASVTQRPTRALIKRSNLKSSSSSDSDVPSHRKRKKGET